MKKSAVTRACVFSTIHRPATMILMDKLEKTGLVTLVGKVNMDRNAPEGLCEKTEESLAETEIWLEEVRAREYRNTGPILTPRFVPSCTDRLLEGLGELQKKVSYVVGLHGGIYYMRKGETCRRIFDDAKAVVPDYPKFKFKGRFNTPGDEPLVALSMAVNGCRPIPFVNEAICCYWEHLEHMEIDLSEGLARVESERPYNTLLVHWGTRYTRQPEYQKQVEMLDILEENDQDQRQKIKTCKKKYDRLMAAEKRRKLARRVKNKIKRTIGIS